MSDKRAVPRSVGSAFPGAVDALALHINQHGRIVGYSGPSLAISRAVMWDVGSIVDLGSLGGVTALAYSINNNDPIAGWASLPDGYFHAVLWDDGAIVDCCEGGTFRGRIGVERYGRPKLAHPATGAFEVDALFPETDGVCLDYRAWRK